MQGLRCHFILMSGKSPTKLEVTSRHDLAVYWDVKRQIKQTKLFSTALRINVHAIYTAIFHDCNSKRQFSDEKM